jgi:hypothetical protein
MKRLFSLFALIIIFSIAGLADIRLPETATPKNPPKGKEVELLIQVSNEVSEPTLVIKKSSSKLLRAALEEAEGVNENTAQVQSEKTTSTASTQTVFGGLFLTLGFVFGGVWLARSKPSKTVIGLFLVGIFAAGTVLVFANIAPPRLFGIDKFMLSDQFQSRSGASARGHVRIKIVNDSSPVTSDIKLLIPRGTENSSIQGKEE